MKRIGLFNMKKIAVVMLLMAAGIAFGAGEKACVKLGQTELFCMEYPGKAATVGKRAQLATNAIERAMADPSMDVDSIVVRREDSVFVVSDGRLRLFTVYPADTIGSGVTVAQLAARWRESTARGIIDERKRSVSAGNLAKLALGVLFPFLIIVAYLLIHRLYTAISKSVVKREGTAFRGIKIRDVEFIPARLQINIILKLLLFFKWLLIVIVFYAMILLFFNLFPATKIYTETILDMSLHWLGSVGKVLIDVAKFVLLAAVFYIAARILWGLADMIFKHYRTSQGTVRIPPEAIDPLRRLAKAIIALLFIVLLAAAIPGPGGYLASSLLLLGFVFVGIAALPFISSALSGFSILILQNIRSGDTIAVGSIRGEVVSVGIIWTKLSIDGETETLVLNKFLLDHPFSITKSSNEDNESEKP